MTRRPPAPRKAQPARRVACAIGLAQGSLRLKAMIMGSNQQDRTRTPRLGWFTASRFFSACVPYLPVATACFLARGLSMGQVVWLSMIYTLGTAVFGVPLAQLADRWGYRRALVLGAGALAVGAGLAAL